MEVSAWVLSSLAPRVMTELQFNGGAFTILTQVMCKLHHLRQQVLYNFLMWLATMLFVRRRAIIDA